MGSLSIWHWLIVLVIVMLVFGTKKLRNIGEDLGGAVKGFKEGMKDASAENKPAADSPSQQVVGGQTIEGEVREKTKAERDAARGGGARPSRSERPRSFLTSGAFKTMFDVGFSELIVIGIVALVVIGPERLPKVARTAGHLLGRMQRYVNDVKADISREMQLDELKKLQAEMQDSARSFQQSVASEMQSVQSLAEQTAQSVTSPPVVEEVTAAAKPPVRFADKI